MWRENGLRRGAKKGPELQRQDHSTLEADVFPYFGATRISLMTPLILLEVLRRVEARRLVETEHPALENCSQVFRYAVSLRKVESNPARDLKGALRKPMVKHFPAITDPERSGDYCVPATAPDEPP